MHTHAGWAHAIRRSTSDVHDSHCSSLHSVIDGVGVPSAHQHGTPRYAVGASAGPDTTTSPRFHRHHNPSEASASTETMPLTNVLADGGTQQAHMASPMHAASDPSASAMAETTGMLGDMTMFGDTTAAFTSSFAWVHANEASAHHRSMGAPSVARGSGVAHGRDPSVAAWEGEPVSERASNRFQSTMSPAAMFRTTAAWPTPGGGETLLYVSLG